MEQNVLIRSMEIGGRTLTLETGKVARQAGGAVLARYGDTVVLVAATASKEPREGIDFFPLTVDFEERMYAVGKIPGGFIKREGRPSTDSVLAARLTDRPIRPLFPKGYRNDVQVVTTVFSVEHDNAAAITSMVGASAALTISEIPFMGPIGSVVVGRVNNELLINPTVAQEEAGDLNLIVSGTAEAVMMVEAGAKEVPEDVVLDAIMFGHDQIKKIVEFINKFREEALALGLAKEKKIPNVVEIPAEIDGAVREQGVPRIAQALDQCIKEKWDKKYREDYFKKLIEEISKEFVETFPDNIKVVRQVLEKVEKEQIRKRVLETGDRLDGRKTDEVRPIWCETGVLPRTHGSGLFTRGQTQVMTITTLGPVGDEQILDGLGLEESKRYMHHYNFPSFSVGETRPNRGPGRREIGHGALAERALLPMIPSVEEFPYTLRLVSEVLESNGSSSMGSVCGSTLSLMDAGVPIKAPVAGVAMGLMKEADKIAILTDIQGAEDHLGDMDFKVAGTEKGVTALQMDIKIGGVTKEILKTALEQAYRGRMHILGKMLEALPEPRKEMSPYAPRIIIHMIDPDKIRTVIGPGGKMIKKIIDETGVKIDIEDDGKVFIAAIDPEAGKRALKIIMDLTEDVEVGKIYLGKVMRIMDFGAFVEVLPGKEGLVHISHLADHRVAKVEDVVSLGEQILVKVLKIDEQGRVNLSRKEAIKAEQAAKEE